MFNLAMRTSWVIPLVFALGFVSAPAQDFPEASVDFHGNNFKNQWYSSELHVLEEPSLYSLSRNPSAESYRFLWLRTFNHPVAVRLDVSPDGTSTVTVKVASGMAGFRPGVLNEQRTKFIDREQTQSFLRRADSLRFWDAPNPVRDQPGEDGSQWIIEGVKHGRYHVVDRWSPTSGIARELGLVLAFDLANMDIPKKDVY